VVIHTKKYFLPVSILNPKKNVDSMTLMECNDDLCHGTGNGATDVWRHMHVNYCLDSAIEKQLSTYI